MELGRDRRRTAAGLVFGGLMTYPAAGKVAETCGLARRGDRRPRPAPGLPAAVVSTGGTPDLYRAHEVTAATEHRPGTYIYLDRYQVAQASARLDDCAMTVLADRRQPADGRRAPSSMPARRSLTSDTLGTDRLRPHHRLPGRGRHRPQRGARPCRADGVGGAAGDRRRGCGSCPTTPASSATSSTRSISSPARRSSTPCRWRRAAG